MTEVDETPTSLLDRVKTGDWLDGQTFPPLSWAVPGILPEGFGLLTGPPKIGKSWLTLGIALAVASGGRALGQLEVGPPRPVLLLALEDGDRRLQERCRRLLGTDPIPPLLHYVTTANAAEVIPMMTAWLALHGRDRPLVILDTLGRVQPPALPGEGAYARDYRVGSRLKAVVDEHPGSTLLAVHHVRKAASEDWMDSTSGTNGTNGSADFTVALTRPRGEASGLLRVTGRDVSEGEYALSTADGIWTLDGADLQHAAASAQETRVTAGLGDRSAEIIRLVATKPDGIRAAEVAEHLDMPPDDARRYLQRLADAGKLRKPSRGLYMCVLSVRSVLFEGDEDSEQDTQDGQDTVSTGCSVCGFPLNPGLAAAGETTHPTCQEAVDA